MTSRALSTTGTSAVYRYAREVLDRLAALEQAVEFARRKAFVVLDGTPSRVDRVSGVDLTAAARYAPRHGGAVPAGAPAPQVVFVDRCRAA